VDHACGAEIAAEAAAHLETCTACRRLFDEQQRRLQDLDQQLEGMLRIDPSERFVPGVMARVTRPAVSWRGAMWWSVPALAAAVLLLATFGPLRSAAHRPAGQPATGAVLPAASTPAADRSIPQAPPKRAPGDPTLVADSRPVERPRRTSPRAAPVRTHVAIPTEQSQAIARYLTLVRSGALDTSALKPGGSDVSAPEDLTIVPLFVEALTVTAVERGAGPSIDRPKSR
jgi:hypothetical protein